MRQRGAAGLWLTVEDENPNAATVLVLTDGAATARMADYERCLELFGRPSASPRPASAGPITRAPVTPLKQWQQGERGWEKKA